MMKKSQNQKSESDILAEKYEKQNEDLLVKEERIFHGRFEVFLNIASLILGISIFIIGWFVLFPLVENGWNNPLTFIFLLSSIGLFFAEWILLGYKNWEISNTYAEYRTSIKRRNILRRTQAQRDEFLRMYELTKSDPDFEAALKELTRNRK